MDDLVPFEVPKAVENPTTHFTGVDVPSEETNTHTKGYMFKATLFFVY